MFFLSFTPKLVIRCASQTLTITRLKQLGDTLIFRVISYLFVIFWCSFTIANDKNVIDISKTLPEGVELYSQLAGVKGMDGWYSALSKTGRFKINFPVPYEEWSVDIAQQNQRTYNLSASTSEGIKLLVTELDHDKNKKLKNTAKLTSHLFAKQQITYTRKLTYKGIKGREIRVDTPTSSKAYRFLFTKQYIYQLSIEYPKQQQILADSIMHGFFESFKLNN